MGSILVGNKKHENIMSYEEKLLGIELGAYVENAEGEIEVHWCKEDYAYARFEVRADSEEQIVNLIENRFGKAVDISNFIVPAYQSHELAMELKDRTIKKIFFVTLEGEKAKTRSIEIYVTEDENDKVYIYIFG